MATVHLPMGYPIQTGFEFETIVFQGNLVRLYTLPADPRNDSQVFERRFLSDITKMRSTLGEFGKQALKTVLGSKWATILYQLIKADINSWYSNSVIEWDAFDSINKDAWRDVAPYQITFNDKGKTFFCLVRVVFNALDHYGEYAFEAEEWGEADSAAALDWWNRDLLNVVTRGKIDNISSSINYPAGWYDEIDASAYLGNYAEGTATSDNNASFYFVGRFLRLYYGKFSGAGTLKVYIDGLLNTSINQSNGSALYQQETNIELEQKGLHYVELEPTINVCNLDAVRVE